MFSEFISSLPKRIHDFNRDRQFSNRKLYFSRQFFLLYFIVDNLFNSHLLPLYDQAYFWSTATAHFNWLNFLPTYSPAGAMVASLASAWIGCLLFFGWNNRLYWGLLTALEAFAYFSNLARDQNHKYLLVILLLFFTITRPDNKKNDRPSYSSFPVLLVSQLSIIYFFAALAKIASPNWLSGHAVAGLRILKFFPLIRLPDEYMIALEMVVTYTTVVIELLLPVALWLKAGRLRNIIVAAGILFHLAIFFKMSAQVRMFSVMMFSLYVLFLPGSWLDRLSTIQKKLAPLFRFKRNLPGLVYYPLLAMGAWLFLVPDTLDYLMALQSPEPMPWPVIFAGAGLMLFVAVFPYIVLRIKASGPVSLVWLARKAPSPAPMAVASIVVIALFLWPGVRDRSGDLLRRGRTGKLQMNAKAREHIRERVVKLAEEKSELAELYVQNIARLSNDLHFLQKICKQLELNCDVKPLPAGLIRNLEDPRAH